MVNLITGPRLRQPSDVVLQCWFAAVLLVVHIPGMPFSMHAANGIAFLTGLSAVRQMAHVAHIRDWISNHRRLTTAICVACIVPALFAHVVFRSLKFRDALNPDSKLQFSAVAPQRDIISHPLVWDHGTKQDCVLAPHPVTSWMLAGVPVPSVASHWLFSATYETQCRLRDKLYSGGWTEESARRFLDGYGITHVLVPEGSPLHHLLRNEVKVASFDSWALYHLAGNRLVKTLPDAEWDPFGRICARRKTNSAPTAFICTRFRSRSETDEGWFSGSTAVENPLQPGTECRQLRDQDATGFCYGFETLPTTRAK